MRRKIVLWGSNEKDEKILVALELLEQENLVNIYTFPENVATEDFYKEMTEKWRDDAEVEFPSSYHKIERKLSVTDSLLPDNIKVERTDVVTRAQAEWHFVVLSTKLHGMYKAELEELKEKVDSLSEFDNQIWEELKSFWNKVQNQVNERNLFREHGAALRERTNSLFDKLKEYKKELDNEFEAKSKEYTEKLQKELDDIEDKIERGLGLNPLFEDLKKLQARVKDLQFTRPDRNKMWSNIDKTFKKLKEKRGSAAQQQANNNLARLEARYAGLINAIQKMKKSIEFDQKDLDFQNKRVDQADGQLESQLRVAKIRMIEERIHSKQEKLDDMLKTQKELESKIEKEKKRLSKAEKMEKLEEAKEVVKQKIADEIKEQSEEMAKFSEKLEKAAENIVKPKKEKKSAMVSAIMASASQLGEDIVDGAKAVTEVLGDAIEDMVDDIKETFSDDEDGNKSRKEDKGDTMEEVSDSTRKEEEE